MDDQTKDKIGIGIIALVGDAALGSIAGVVKDAVSVSKQRRSRRKSFDVSTAKLAFDKRIRSRR